MSENLSMVVLMGRIGQLLGVTRWQLKSSHGTVAVGVYEFDDDQDEIAPAVAMMELSGRAMTRGQEKELFEQICAVVEKDSKEEKFDTERYPALCLQIGTKRRHLGSVIIATSLKGRDKSISNPIAIGQIVRWINENVEQDEKVRVLNVYGKFAGDDAIYEADFTH